jgi:hypothetical protein
MGLARRLFADEGGASPPTPSFPRGDPCIDLLFQYIERHWT